MNGTGRKLLIFFRKQKGNVAKPFWIALDALLIQQKYGYSDEEMVFQIQENSYLQFFTGLPDFRDDKPFDSSTMVFFRKRLTIEKLISVNKTIIASHESKTEVSDSTDDDDSNGLSNKGTLMPDTNCAPSYINYPQDIGLLNDVRLNVEKTIDDLFQVYRFPKPRTYRKITHKQLDYVTRDIRYIKEMKATGISLSKKQVLDFDIIQHILEQQ